MAVAAAWLAPGPSARATIVPSWMRTAASAAVAEPITSRPDDDARRALAVLAQDGTPVSTTVRAALITAASTAARDRLRAEAAALAADEADRAEAAQVLRDMETLRAR